MSKLSQDYVDRCAVDEGLRNAVARMPKSPEFEKAWGGRLLPQPWFVEHDEISEFARDLSGLFDLLVTLPVRLFNGDLASYAAAVGINATRLPILLRAANGHPSRFGRADVYHDGSRYRVLEFNLGSEAGGTEIATSHRALLKVPEFRAFADENRLRFVDPAAELAIELRELGATYSNGAKPVAAIIEGTGALEKYGAHWYSLQEAMIAHGLDVMVAEIGDLTTLPSGKLSLRGTPIDVIFRTFTSAQLLMEPDGPEVAAPLFDAHDAGQTALYTTLESGLFATKGVLALLWDPQHRSAFDEGELALVERVLPWTRMLDGDSPADLLDQCRDQRTELLLKPVAGFGGVGAYAGWERTPQEWEEALATAVREGYVVQQRVDPRPEPVYDPATGTVTEWNATLGVFLTERGYAGTYCRADRREGRAVIGLGSNPDARVTAVFSRVPGEGPLNAD